MAKKLLKILRYIFMAAVVCVLIYIAKQNFDSRQSIVYTEHLDEIVATVDDIDISMRDLAMYIVYEERVVEEEALIYNRKRTRQFWNVHTNHSFVQSQVKQAVLDMAIHDMLFYDLAIKENIGFTDDDEVTIENVTTDFWEDLLDEQVDRMPVTTSEINDQIRRAAMAEKYQNMKAEVYGPSVAAYKYDGYYYKKILEEHNVVINDKLWDRFVIGGVTLNHTSAIEN